MEDKFERKEYGEFVEIKEVDPLGNSYGNLKVGKDIVGEHWASIENYDGDLWYPVSEMFFIAVKEEFSG